MRCKYCGEVIIGDYPSVRGSHWPNPTLITDRNHSYCENAPPTIIDRTHYQFHVAATFKDYAISLQTLR